MRSATDVERYLNDSAVSFQALGGGLFIVSDANSGLRNLAIQVSDEVVVFQLKVMEMPAPGPARERLYEQLLRLNGSGLLHAAFGLQSDGIYLQAALPLANLDPNELQAVLDDIGMARAQHVPQLEKSEEAN